MKKHFTAVRNSSQTSHSNSVRVSRSSISFILILLIGRALFGADIRLGIVSTDTSHVIHFTRILNEARDPGHVPGARVVAAYKGGSSDIPSSRNRVDGFEQQLIKTYHVEIVPDIPTLCSKVDGLLLESGDGRVHLAQARQAIAAKKPLFIDPPLASTLEQAREIARLAKEVGVPGSVPQRSGSMRSQPARRTQMRPVWTCGGPGPWRSTITSISLGTPFIPSSFFLH